MGRLLLLLIVVAFGGGLSFGPVLPAAPAVAQEADTDGDGTPDSSDPSPVASLGHSTAKKKKCKKGYVLKKVNQTKRINGKSFYTGRMVKKCVKKKNGPAQPNPVPTPPDPVPTPPDPVPTPPDPVPTPPDPVPTPPDPVPTPPDPVSCPTPYTGVATGMDGVFEYGAVRIDRTCDQVTRVEIKSVTTRCGIYFFTGVLVFDPSSAYIGIGEGSGQIVGDEMHVVYQPEKTSDNYTTMDITFAGDTATGEFHSVGNCRQDGLFTATAG